MKFSQLQYRRPNFIHIMDELHKAYEDIEKAENALEQCKSFEKYYTLLDDFYTQYALVRIRHFLNTNDGFYRDEQRLFSQNMPKIHLKENEIIKLILNSPFKEDIEQKIGSVAMNKYELYNKTISKDIMEDMREENALVLEYVGIISKLSVHFDEKTIPLSMLAPYKESTDREIRKKAYIVEGNAYNSVKDKLDEIFSKLVKNRDNQAKKLGFYSYVELGYARMSRDCYNSEDIAVFKKQVRENIVPIVKDIMLNRKKRLELDEMFFYDLTLMFKEGSPKPKISAEEIIANGRKMYKEMSEFSSELIDVLIDNELIDVYPKIGKSPGGFCSYLKKFNYPFIFANFNNTSFDVYVFTHEAGHALAKYLQGVKNEIQYTNTTMDISETHSMAMEFLTSPWHELFFKDETDNYQLAQAENALTLILYACQVDEFQEQVYLNPDWTPKERDEKWLEIEKEYRPFVQSEHIPFYCDGAGWQRQTHIYKTPFYYIDYALAQMMAIQFFLEFLKDKEKSYEKYFEFLSFGSKKTFVDLIKTVRLKSPLEEGTLKPIVQDLYTWIQEHY